MDKLRKLEAFFRELETCLIAYSGGVDSAFLATVAHRVLGDRATAILADSPSLPRRELVEAKALAQKIGFKLEIVHTQEFDNEQYVENPVNRCFFCKEALFTEMSRLAEARSPAVLVYGENADDAADVRPGAQAAQAAHVRAPLKELGFSKEEIRHYSNQLGLPTADKPQMACLSSRIPFGEIVSPQKLSLIERAEEILRDLGWKEFRVRHHEMKQGALARIEIPPQFMSVYLAQAETPSHIDQLFRELGYTYVTLDLKGYHRAQPALPSSP